MTARNIALMNATYPSVPAVNLPISGGGTATFTEITDTTATASDVASGKYFYTADGTKTEGTSSGGGTTPWSITFLDDVDVDEESVYFAGDDTIVNLGGFIMQLAGVSGSPQAGDIIAVMGSFGNGIYAWIVNNNNQVERVYCEDGEIGVDFSGHNIVLTEHTNYWSFHGGYHMYAIHGRQEAFSFNTATCQPASGQTSGTFTVTDEPVLYLCGLDTTVAFAQYHRVETVMYLDEDVDPAGEGYKSGTNFYTSTIGIINDLTCTYNNGSLTIATSGANNGGYFHNPGQYTLFYITEDDLSGLQTKTATPSSSQQTITADEGETLGKVIVEPIPSSYVQPTATKGATTYPASTSDQTIASGTYLTGTQTIKGYAVQAKEFTSNGTYTPDNGFNGFYTVTVNVAGGGSSKNVQVLQSTSRTNASSLTKVLGDLTVSKTGTYDIYWSGGRTNTSTSYTWGTRLYVDGSGYGTENTTWTNNCQSNHLSNVSLTANQKLSVYARGRTGSYYTFAPMLVIVEA